MAILHYEIWRQTIDLGNQKSGVLVQLVASGAIAIPALTLSGETYVASPSQVYF